MAEDKTTITLTGASAGSDALLIDELTAKTSALAFTDQLGTDLVDLYVGPEKKRFVVNKILLLARVAYFKKMFAGGFKEAHENTAYFPEDKPEVFALLIEWFYKDSYQQIPENASLPVVRGMLRLRLEVYALADKLCMLDLADYTMTSYLSAYALHRMSSSAITVNLAYDLLDSSSPMLRYHQDHVYFALVVITPGSNMSWSSINRASNLVANPELLEAVLDRLHRREQASLRETAVDPVKYPCKYHHHPNGEERCAYRSRNT